MANKKLNKEIDSKPEIKTVNRIIQSIETKEGEGFIVHRPFPSYNLSYFDPFLLLDEMGPMDSKPGEAKGAPDHPHRGFETVTYLLEGEFEHKDSNTNHGVLKPGDIQWMTAGSGVIHSEMPTDAFFKKGGRLHGFQLWINLPAKDKMINPKYQDISSADIPVVKIDKGITVKIISGKLGDKSAATKTRIPILYYHITIQPGSEFVTSVPTDYNTFLYLFDGNIVLGQDDLRIDAGQMVLFNHDGTEIIMKVPKIETKSAELLLLAGIPLNEPVARYGPFVMNTKMEIEQALEDYRNGTFGKINRFA